MFRWAWHRFRSGLAWAVVAGALALALPASGAEQAAEYEYDELGRLKRVVAPEREISYTLDPAGNRNALSTPAGRGWPSSFTVPPNSLTGDYTVSWGASTGTGTRYELYEATNPDFASETQVYNNTGLSKPFTAKPDNTYYYRVRACDATNCGPHRTGANPTLVLRPPVPGVPGGMTIPVGDIDGTYTISWGASSGTVTAYELYEATNSGFSGASLVYSGTTASAGVSGRGNGNYYYRVRACNTAVSCSTYRTGANYVWVTLPPAVPGAPFVPQYNNTGAYIVTWGGSSTGIVTAYELLELASGGGAESLIYSGTNQNFSVSGRAQAAYVYRVRACNGPACSAYTASPVSGNTVVVDLSPPTPPTSLNRTGDDTLYWSGGSGDTGGSGVDRWRVYRSGTLAGTTTTIQSFADTGAPSNQTYTYTVRSLDRAGNESLTSSPGLTFYVDTIPPNAPTGFSGVVVDAQTISLSWNAATDPNGGTVAGYHLTRNGAGPLYAGAATSYTDSPIAASTTYTYTVRAYDTRGNYSPHSAPVTLTTPAPPPTVPLIPLGLHFERPEGTKPNNRIYSVVWSAVSSPPTVTYYVLQETFGSNVVTYTVNAPATLREFAKTVGGTYGYRVQACTAANVCSGYSGSISKSVCVGTSCNL